jgi:hypothetical protein
MTAKTKMTMGRRGFFGQNRRVVVMTMLMAMITIMILRMGMTRTTRWKGLEGSARSGSA